MTTDNHNNLPVNTVLRRPVPMQYGMGGFSQQETASTESDPSFEDLLPVLRKRRRLILLVTLAFLGMAMLYCSFATRLYTATAALEIRGYSPVLTGTVGDTMYGTDTRKIDYQKTTIAKLRRTGIADKVLSSGELDTAVRQYLGERRGIVNNVTGWIKDSMIWVVESVVGELDSGDAPGDGSAGAAPELYNHKTKFIQSYLGLIDVNPVPDTSLVEIAVTTANPRLSQRIANAHAEGFIHEIRNERQETVLVNMHMLQTQANDLKVRLESAEHELAKYAESNSLMATEKSDESDVMMKQIGRLNELLGEAVAKRVATESLFKEIDKKPAQEASSIDDDSVRQLRTALFQVEAEMAQLGEKVTDEYPEMRESRARAESLRRAIGVERQRLTRGLRINYDTTVATEKRLADQIEQEKGKMNGVSKRLVQYNLLRKEADSIRDLYQTILKQIQEAQVIASSTGSSVFMGELAPLPNKPSSPRTELVMMTSFFVGLIVAIGVALMIELMNNRVITPEEAGSSLGLPLIGFIPAFSADADPNESPPSLAMRLAKRLGLPGKSFENLPVVKSDDVVEERIIAIAKPRAVVSEALRTIRAGILISSVDNPPKVVMITSANKGDGKTVLSANLAVTLAQASHRTLVIDADLRQRRAGRMFNVAPDSMGLSDVLAGRVSVEEAIQRSHVEGLDVLPAGSRPPNPAELVGSKRMIELVARLRDQYDFILLDTPPVLPVSDSLHLSRVADSVVLVVRSNVTEKGAVHETRRRLLRVNARLLGIVLNDFDLKKFGVASSSTRTYYGDDEEPVASVG